MPELQLTAQQITSIFQPLIKKSAKNLRLLDGFLQGSFQSHISSKQLKAKGEVSIKNSFIMIEKLALENLNLNTKLKSIEPLQLEGNIKVPSILLGSGVNVKNSKVQFISHNQNSFSLFGLSTELFGGKLKAAPIHIQPRKIQQTNIQIERLDLAQLIQFSELEGAYTEGKISLSLPISMENNRFFIKNGQIQSFGPGIIKYQSEDLTSNANNIAMQALENFHYQSISGTVNYYEEGQEGRYKLSLKLLGSNPDLYAGKAIEFNLNIDGKLPALFIELFLTGDIGETILQKYKDQGIDIHRNN